MKKSVLEKYDWPEEVYILDSNCNISSYFGKVDEGYPNTINEWVSFSLASTKDHYYIDALWWSVWYKAIRLRQEPHSLASMELNSRVRTYHNCIWYYFGYTENQSSLIGRLCNIMPVFKDDPDSLLQDTIYLSGVKNAHGKEKTIKKRGGHKIPKEKRADTNQKA